MPIRTRSWAGACLRRWRQNIRWRPSGWPSRRLLQQSNYVYKFDKSTGEVKDIWNNSTTVRPVNEPKNDVFKGFVKYCLYYGDHSNIYLLNLKTGKVYRFDLVSNEWTWKPM